MKAVTTKHTLRSAGLALWVSALTFNTWAATQLLDSVVAIVDDDIIMSSELRERLDMVQASLAAQNVEAPPQEVLVRETLDQLILENIQLQMGRNAGVRISDSQLNAAVTRVAAQNRMTLDQFRLQLEQEGKSYEKMREDIRRELILQRVQAGNVNQRIQITEQEALNYLESPEGRELVAEEYHLIHALLALPAETSAREIAAARAHVDALYGRIQAGESFQSVISSSAEPFQFTGGDLGWRKRADLPSLFAEVAPELELGQTAAPLQNPAGFHLIYLADKRGGKTIVPQTHVRHILIKPSAIRSQDETRDFTAQLRQQIIDGADFTEVARANSEDIGSAQEGGDLDWVNPGQMVVEFEKVMNDTEVGAISEPFNSQFGWHILEVLDRRQEDLTEMVAKNRAREVLHQRKFEEELAAWLGKIRDEAFVDIK
ncbi:MAG: peptidylprolyl isomerase [Gammaproteobacteria bacterium]|nr:peptidylprolyl isomerase [Gammaproteobacteria bacterium]